MKSLFKLARKFQLKYGQGDPFSELSKDITKMVDEETDHQKDEEKKNYLKILQEKWAQENNLSLPLTEDQLGEMWGDPEFYHKWNDFIHNLDGREQMEREFHQQDKDIAKQQAQEQAQREAYQKSIAGKTPFNTNDARNLVNIFIPQMKQKVPDLKGIIFNFKSTGEVIISSTANANGANILRKEFALQLFMSLKQYLINYKKYLVSGNISFTL
jgi:hypothetical protein